MTTDDRLLKLASRIAKLGLAAPPLADLPGLLGMDPNALATDLAALIRGGLPSSGRSARAGPR